MKTLATAVLSVLLCAPTLAEKPGDAIDLTVTTKLADGQYGAELKSSTGATISTTEILVTVEGVQDLRFVAPVVPAGRYM